MECKPAPYKPHLTVAGTRQIKDMLSKGFRSKEIAYKLGVSYNSIRYVIEKLGLTKYIKYTDEERQKMAELYNQGKSYEYIAQVFNRTPAAIRTQMSVLRSLGYYVRDRRHRYSKIKNKQLE